MGWSSVTDVAKIVEKENAFTTTTDLVSIASGEQDFLLLKNPSGSTKRLLVTHFSFGVDSSNTRSVIRVYANPTITSDGTTLNVINTYVKSGAQAAEGEAYRAPTISDRGGRLNMVIRAADADSRGMSRFYWVDPGNSVLMTVDNSQNNADSFGDVYWLEFDDA